MPQQRIPASALAALFEREKKPASKYGAQRTEYNGVLFDSKLEARHAARLDVLVRFKQIAGWERQVRFDLVANGVKIGVYRADFVVTGLDGARWIQEAKGYARRGWNRTVKLMKACHPEMRIEVIER